MGGLGPLLGLMLAVLAALGAYVGGLGSGSGPKLAVLGGLGAKVVGLGSDQGEKWPKPERESDLASGSRRKSGPNPSRKAVLGRAPFSHVFGRFPFFSVAGARCRFFSVDIF